MANTSEEAVDAPLSPAIPEDIYFNQSQKAWIASRHGDVLAALRSLELVQSRPPKRGDKANATNEEESPEAVIAPALPHFPASKWQLDAESLAMQWLRDLPRQRPVDLAADFIQPWCLACALNFTGIPATHTERLKELVKRLSESDAAPADARLKALARKANNALDCISQTSSTSFKSLFLGAAQTMPTFLGSAWAALLQHPDQMRRLRKHPELMPKTTEELLRYAGPVHTVFRQAAFDMDLCGTEIRCGERLNLRLASANRDPNRFHEPNILDVSRDLVGHLALSHGRHYCAGSHLVRLMTRIGITAILARFSEVRWAGAAEWHCGTMLIWPSSLPVMLA